MTVPHGPVDALLAELHASRRGLTADEARRRLGEVGPNEPARAPRTAGLVQILLLLANPLVIILLIASLASAVLGERVNASIIVLMVALSVALNFVQTYRSHRVAERLRDAVAPTATALRDGTWSEIRRRELVPGDIVRLAAGDRVPADARLLEARDLHVQQAALTGESMPAEKDAGDIEVAPRQPADARNVVFLGTSVVSGTATALVVATGPFFLVLFVLLAGALLHHAFLESLLFAVALAVGLTPEFLPMISAVTLSRGAAHMARQKVIVKHLEAIENFGSMDVLCSDKTGTLTSGDMMLDRHLDPFGQVSERPFTLAYVNSSHQTGIKSPLDEAILKRGGAGISGYRKIDEIPFDFERRRLSVVVENSGGRLLITKGAPEGVIACCTTYEVDDRRAALDEAMRARCEATYRELSAQGSRVLAVAYAVAPLQAVYSARDECELVLAGFVTFFDPPMEGVAETLRALRRDGVVVKILTGDNELVAQHVCGQVRLDSARIVGGDEIERMTDSALAAVAEHTTVFARVSPAQKNRIILALKSRNHVVGFLGDGINDAPSIHTADVGVSVATAVDVAKDAADIILLERDLDVLHAGILEGRRAFGNVMKYLLMGTSSNFGNMF
ncbi:MAG: magnesium-translocating P-type ATPase, partial [Candidatus Rokubacteria bacterium 13_2_20CM_2_64_8]